MKKVAVPTDFSECSKNAVVYAAGLLKEMGGGVLELIHIYMPNIDAEYPVFVPPVNDFIKEKEETLRLFVEGIQHQEFIDESLINVKQVFVVGFPAEEICQLSSNYDLMVMGKTGSSNILDKFFGSVSTTVAEKSKCPVLLIPEDMVFTPIRKLMFGSNYESIKHTVLSKLINFNSYFNAKLHFVHIDDSFSESFQDEAQVIIEEMMNNEWSSTPFEISEIKADSVIEGFNQYVKANSIDILILVNINKSILEHIFERSTTKAMAFQIKIPLMIYHL
jgi:nucleotide-binding universal stress UspA family protein